MLATAATQPPRLHSRGADCGAAARGHRNALQSCRLRAAAAAGDAPPAETHSRTPAAHPSSIIPEASLAACSSWRDVQRLRAVAAGPPGADDGDADSQAAYFRAVAVAAARVVRRQALAAAAACAADAHSLDAAADWQARGATPPPQQQQQYPPFVLELLREHGALALLQRVGNDSGESRAQRGVATRAWRWYHDTLLLPCSKLAVQEDGAASSTRLNGVTAAALLQAAAAMGFGSSGFMLAAGEQAAADEALCALLACALQAFTATSSSSSSSGGWAAVPPIGVIKLVDAAQQLQLTHSSAGLQDAALAAALVRSASPGSSSSSTGQPGVSFTAAMNLLSRRVLLGQPLAAAAHTALVECVQAHVTKRPQLLVPLLTRLAQLKQQQQLSAAGLQQLQTFRVALLPALQQRASSWARLLNVLQSHVLTLLLGPQWRQQKQQQQQQRQGSDDRLKQQQGRRNNNSRPAGAQLGFMLRDWRAAAPHLTGSFQDVTEAMVLLAELPPHHGLAPLKQLLAAASLHLLQQQLAATGRAKGSNDSGGVEPQHISSWLTKLAELRVLDSREQRTELAHMLLEVLSPPFAAGGGRGDSDGSSTRRGHTWPPTVLVPLLQAASALHLPPVAGPEWWPAVQPHIAQQPRAYSPTHALAVLQCLSKHSARADQPFVAQLLETACKPLPSSSSSSRSLQGLQPGASHTQLQVPQLVDLLGVLVALRHRVNAGWWDAFQTQLLSAADAAAQAHAQRQQQQRAGDTAASTQAEQEQELHRRLAEAAGPWQRSWCEAQLQAGSLQQQDGRLTTALTARVIWAAGRLRQSLQPQVLTLLLQRLFGCADELQQLSGQQLTALITGLAKLIPGVPGAVRAHSYRWLCSLLKQQQLEPADAANIIRCLGSIADSTAAAAAGDGSGEELQARVAALQSTAWAEAGRRQQAQHQQQRQRRQQKVLRPYDDVVQHLCDVVEPQLEQLDGTSLTMLLWGLRKLGFVPSEAFAARYQEVVLQTALASPGLPDHECAMVLASLAHMGVAICPPLLQELLYRSPRFNVSAGILADLTSALKLLVEQGEVASTGEQPAPGWQVEAASSSSASFESEEEVDSLIDSLRDDLGAAKALWRGSEADGSAAQKEEQLDPELAARIRQRLAIVEELLQDSGGTS